MTANAPIEWGPALDPSDEKDYLADWEDFLTNEGDTISTYTITLSTTAIAGGLEAPTQILDASVGVTIWFQINAANQADVAYNNSGIRYDVEVEIVTVGARTFQKTWSLLVAHQ